MCICYIPTSTLTHVNEPYPMLILCGPPGAGKGHFAQLLVEEFPSFFGLGWVKDSPLGWYSDVQKLPFLRVSHTTRPQRPKESHGRDYFFINDSTFSIASSSVSACVYSYSSQVFSFSLRFKFFLGLFKAFFSRRPWIDQNIDEGVFIVHTILYKTIHLKT